MGSKIRPNCMNCEAEFEVIYLGILFNDDHNCYAPVICDNCGTIVTDNILEPRNTCKECSKPLVYAGSLTTKETFISVFTCRLSKDLITKRFYVLKSNLYKCPRCHTRNLSFATEGCWS
ncbi:MAG TPA: hypothetical protein VK172_09170 [Lentimicrobium sp.]|nr:hypothetical protein [Lentimicrobium sp.]